MEAFLAVAEELHFGHAARRLRMAQPPLSRTIKLLEAELGCRLFERSTRAVRLTQEGQALLQPAYDIIDAFAAAKMSVTSAGKGVIGRVRIGFAGASSYTMVGQLARVVKQAHPGIALTLNSAAYATRALEQVINHELDLAIVRWRVAPAGIASRIVAVEELLMALPQDHPRAALECVDLRDFKDEPFITLPEESGSSVRQALLDACTDSGFVPRIVQSAPDSWSILALVAADVGCNLTVSSIPDNVVNPGVVYRPLVQRLEPLTVRLAWRQANPNPALMEVLRLSETALPTPG